MNSDIDMATRNSKLISLSQMLVDNKITYKLDLIANVRINGLNYFSVFRRYNSVYEIVIEDMRGDIYCHKDYRVRDSLKEVLCLNSAEADKMYTNSATSYKYNSPLSSIAAEIADMRWSELQARYYAVTVNFGGILHDFQQSYEDYHVAHQTANQEGVTHNSTYKGVLNPEEEEQEERQDEKYEVANIMLTLSIPSVTDPWSNPSITDGPSLSMRYADVQKRKRSREVACYYHMNSDEELSDDNYTVLRNGTRIPKPL